MMKKILTTIVVLFAIFGATTASAEFRYGPVVGINQNNLKFSQHLFTVDDKTGYSVGVFGEKMFPGIGFGLDIACMYTQRGAALHLGERKVWESSGYGVERVYLHSLEIPLNLRFKFHRLAGVEDYIAPFLFAGPSFSVNLPIQEHDAVENSFGDIGLQFGVGLEIYKKVQISMSYNRAITKCLSTVKLDEFEAKNHAVCFKLAYFLK